MLAVLLARSAHTPRPMKSKLPQRVLGQLSIGSDVAVGVHDIEYLLIPSWYLPCGLLEQATCEVAGFRREFRKEGMMPSPAKELPAWSTAYPLNPQPRTCHYTANARKILTNRAASHTL